MHASASCAGCRLAQTTRLAQKEAGDVNPVHLGVDSHLEHIHCDMTPLHAPQNLQLSAE